MTKKNLRKMFDDGRYDEIYECLMNGSIDDKWNIVEKSNGNYDAMFESVIPEILGYQVTVVSEPKKKKTRKSVPASFSKNDIADYFKMTRDGRCGMYRGYVYLEVRKRNGKNHYKVFRLIKGMEKFDTEDFAWAVVCETYNVNEAMGCLFVFNDYEAYDWNVPYPEVVGASSAWNMFGEVVSNYVFDAKASDFEKKSTSKTSKKNKNENEIVKVLVERDGYTKKEAQDRLKSARAEWYSMMDEGASYNDLEDFLATEFGLEPDYIFDLLGC